MCTGQTASVADARQSKCDRATCRLAPFHTIYDYKNRRITKTVGTTITRYIWDGWQVLAEYDGNTGNLTTEYVYSGNRLIGQFAGGTTLYYLRDNLSERVVLDVNGAVVGRMAHLPFGEELGNSGNVEKHKFTSYERDSETATDYAINRQYTQSIGRFMRTDPERKSCDYNTPQSLNRYTYVKDDPINRVDPLGLDDSFGESGGLQVCEIDPVTEELVCEFRLVPISGGQHKRPPKLSPCDVCRQKEQKKCEATRDKCFKKASHRFFSTLNEVCSLRPTKPERQECEKEARKILHHEEENCNNDLDDCVRKIDSKCNARCNPANF